MLLAGPFIANGGRAPFINPTPLARWAYGRALPPGRKDEALANKTVFVDLVVERGRASRFGHVFGRGAALSAEPGRDELQE